MCEFVSLSVYGSSNKEKQAVWILACALTQSVCAAENVMMVQILRMNFNTNSVSNITDPGQSFTGNIFIFWFIFKH